MKTGDQVILMVKEAGKERRMILRELLVDEAGVLSVTTENTSSGWPTRLRLRPERLEESPMLQGHRALFLYQDDVVPPG